MPNKIPLFNYNKSSTSIDVPNTRNLRFYYYGFLSVRGDTVRHYYMSSKKEDEVTIKPKNIKLAIEATAYTREGGSSEGKKLNIYYLVRTNNLKAAAAGHDPLISTIEGKYPTSLIDEVGSFSGSGKKIEIDHNYMWVRSVKSDVSNNSTSDDSDTTIIDEDTPGEGSPAVTVIETIDPNSLLYEEVISRIEDTVSNKTRSEYGVLFDNRTSESFNFYIPEFSESAGSQYGDISIPGRSVDIKYYERTSSRGITVDLELFAGAGLYERQSGETNRQSVDRLHRDINFVKSLEYPDYETPTGVVAPPNTVTLSLGRAVCITGVVTSVTVNHLKPLDSLGRAMYVKLSFTVVQTNSVPPSYQDIRNLSTRNNNGIFTRTSTATPANKTTSGGTGTYTSYRGGK